MSEAAVPVPEESAAPPVLEGPERIRAAVAGWRALNQTVALVPTMGNLHAGHLRLARLARRIADRVVVSIFVNPTQFGPNEDFAGYPRTLDEDVAKLAAEGTADALYVPSVEEIYPLGLERAVRFVLPAISRELCGASRPGHFDGVASVVCRLLNIVAPETLLLGRKDYQQLVIVGQMIRDLNLPVRLASGPTVRAADGLALSSRNAYLSADERGRAPALYETLRSVRDAVRAGRRDFAALAAQAVERLRSEGFAPDYVEVRRAGDLAQPAGAEDGESLIVLGAAWLGRARLIDNLAL